MAHLATSPLVMTAVTEAIEATEATEAIDGIADEADPRAAPTATEEETKMPMLRVAATETVSARIATVAVVVLALLEAEEIGETAENESGIAIVALEETTAATMEAGPLDVIATCLTTAVVTDAIVVTEAVMTGVDMTVVATTEEDPTENRRGRSATPPPKKREPTPDLTDVVPVTERKRRMTQWDIKPPGYENVTAEQAKLSGMFPLPGAPRQQPMDPTKLQAFMNQPGGNVNSAALKPGNSRQSKRLLVYNLPPGSTDESVLSFFNLQLNGLNVIESTDPCVLCQTSKDQSFALLEFRHASEATVALALDGISMETDDPMNGTGSGSGLKIQRPKDYIVPAVADETAYEPGVVSKVVVDTPNKISVSNLPPYLTEEQVLELLVAFGELKALVLVKDNGTEESRGIAFCEFVDPAATDIAIQGLNGMLIGDKNLKVRKASIGITQVSGVEMGVNAMSMLAGTTASTDSEETRVLQLLNMVTPEELMDHEDYEEICEDVQEECAKYGQILGLKVPRPSGGSRQSAGVGKIFVKYDTTASAKKALQALAGRKFADRTVVTTYFPEENFEVGAW
ncbi:Uu.00g048490.m01.CDS01 [Anthostomella pinea]|uniref:Splicing factor U2AF subunit n=1 Tax=Anthostomella pinea TaxID=933095 RepID=A0AAI8VBS0_9PEZI|nr:Uu.00g048490.m01.CDS01 [Anthostomella pinea]